MLYICMHFSLIFILSYIFVSGSIRLQFTWYDQLCMSHHDMCGCVTVCARMCICAHVRMCMWTCVYLCASLYACVGCVWRTVYVYTVRRTVYVCVIVYSCACMYVCVYVRMYVRMCMCVLVYMYVCMCIYMS